MRSYDQSIADVMEDIETTTRWTPDAVRTAFEDAAHMFRKRTEEFMTSAEYAGAFADDVAGLTAVQRAELATKLGARELPD